MAHHMESLWFFGYSNKTQIQARPNTLKQQVNLNLPHKKQPGKWSTKKRDTDSAILTQSTKIYSERYVLTYAVRHIIDLSLDQNYRDVTMSQRW